MTERRRILLIGRRKSVLISLSEALQQAGFVAEWTDDISSADIDYRANEFDLISFGRGVDDVTRSHLQLLYQTQNPAIRFVRGLAPIIPLLVDQIKAAFLEKPENESVLQDFQITRANDIQMDLTLREDCHLELNLYSLNPFFKVHQTQHRAQKARKGSFTFSLDRKQLGWLGKHFIVLKINGDEIEIRQIA